MDKKTQELLNQLRDIHLPPAIADWPWATGRFITIAVLLIALAVGAFFIWKRWQKKRRQEKFLQQLRELQTTNNFAGLSALLKRVALYAYPKEDVAGLHDKAWLEFLDRTNVKNATQHFQSPVGELLLDIPYRKSVDDVDAQKRDELFKMVEEWLLFNY